MKHMKILGLALVAATAFMALVGVGSASAAGTLCTTNTTPCTSKLAGESEIKATLIEGNAVLTAGLGKVECSESGIAGKTGAAEGSNTGTLSELSFSECNATVTTEAPGTLTINHKAGTMDGNLTAEGFKVFVKLGAIECTYGGTVAEKITSSGNSPMIVKAASAPIPREKGGILCGNPAKWTATYEVTTPGTLYVAE